MAPVKFFMVWVHDTPTTKHRHPSYEAARAEADRIAMLPMNRGRKVYILEALDWRCNDGMPKVEL
jgi:hypothetical protein